MAVRLAYLKDLNTHAFSVGLVGFNLSRQPERIDGGPVNRYRDSVPMPGTNTWAPGCTTSRLRELRARGSDADDLIATGGATNPTGRLRLPLQRVLLLHQTTASRSAASPSTDSPIRSVFLFANSSPDTVGTVSRRLHAVWQRGLMGRPSPTRGSACKYTVYNQVRRRHHNYDGTGRNASDNNAVPVSMVGDLAMGEFYEVARDFANEPCSF